MIGIIFIIYCIFITFVTGKLKSNLLSLLKLLVPGWGEHKDAHGWLCIAEDTSGVRPNFILYEIVCKTYFKFLQQHKTRKLTSEFIAMFDKNNLSCFVTLFNELIVDNLDA
jgi:hypothetical protein